MLDKQAPDILAVTEFRLRTEVEDAEIMLPGYDRHDRQIKKGCRGILIYSHKCLPSERITHLTSRTS